MYEINETHDPNLKSWVESANDPNTDFPIQNLPFCFIESYDHNCYVEPAIRIGDQYLRVGACIYGGLFDDIGANLSREILEKVVVAQYGLGGFISLNSKERLAIRLQLSKILRDDAETATRERASQFLIPSSTADLEVYVPFEIGDYTDFYCSIFHATNVGSMFRPDAPLLPNYKYVPIGYHGRASSIVASGTDIKRPHGQNRSDAEKPPVFIPAKNLDYEMELGFFVGRVVTRWASLSRSRRPKKHIFGMCLVNDWSARDIQAWEVSAARAVPREELRDDDLAVRRDDGGSRSVSHTGVRARSRRSAAARLSE